MKTYIALLRGINVSGQKRIAMHDLRVLVESLGLQNVRTYVQSGNVIFNSSQSDQALLTVQIEQEIEKSMGYSVRVFLRDSDDLEKVFINNPFLTDRNEDPTRLHVTFLYTTANFAALHDVKSPNPDADDFIAGENEIYVFCPDGYGKTKFNNNFFERKLDQPATTRNWNTVTELLRLVSEAGG